MFRNGTAVLWAAVFAVAFAHNAARACVVGSGTSASCTEEALDACLPGGGSFNGAVTFNCGGAGAITVTSAKTISSATAIDGGGVITISGGGATQVLNVSSGVSLTLANLTISGGNHSNSVGGGLFNGGGGVTVINCTFSGNTTGCPDVGCPNEGGGGGIANYGGGTLTVTNSTFSGNTGGWLGGGSLEQREHADGCQQHLHG